MAGFIFVYIWNRSRVWENHTARLSKGAVMDQKANLKIKTCWIVAQLLAHKLVNFASLTQSFIVSFSKLVQTLILNANTANIKLFGPEKLSGRSRNRPQLCNAYLSWSIYVNRPQQILDNRVNKNTGGAKFTLLSKLRTWSTLNLDTKIAFAVIWFYYRIFLWLLTSYLNMHVLAILNL